MLTMPTRLGEIASPRDIRPWRYITIAPRPGNWFDFWHNSHTGQLHPTTSALNHPEWSD